MAFGDRPPLTGPQKAGCALVAVVGFLSTLAATLFAILISCRGCEPNPIATLLIVGVPITFIIIGILTIRHFMREKN